MILDICFQNEKPEQIQKVRMFTVYPHQDGSAKPEIVIHFPFAPQRNIDMRRILSITVTND